MILFTTEAAVFKERISYFFRLYKGQDFQNNAFFSHGKVNQVFEVQDWEKSCV